MEERGAHLKKRKRAMTTVRKERKKLENKKRTGLKRKLEKKTQIKNLSALKNCLHCRIWCFFFSHSDQKEMCANSTSEELKKSMNVSQTGCGESLK